MSTSTLTEVMGSILLLSRGGGSGVDFSCPMLYDILGRCITCIDIPKCYLLSSFAISTGMIGAIHLQKVNYSWI